VKAVQEERVRAAQLKAEEERKAAAANAAEVFAFSLLSSQYLAAARLSTRFYFVCRH